MNKKGKKDDKSSLLNKKDLEYKSFTTENTPWFLANTASCIVDLPNIEQIATGSYSNRIELWILRTESDEELGLVDSKATSTFTKSKQSKGVKT